MTPAFAQLTADRLVQAYHGRLSRPLASRMTKVLLILDRKELKRGKNNP